AAIRVDMAGGLFVGMWIDNLRISPRTLQLVADAGGVFQRFLQQFLQCEYGRADCRPTQQRTGQGQTAAEFGCDVDVQVVVACGQTGTADDPDAGAGGFDGQVVGKGIAAVDLEVTGDLIEFQAFADDVAEIEFQAPWQHIQVEQTEQTTGTRVDRANRTITDLQLQRTAERG